MTEPEKLKRYKKKKKKTLNVISFDEEVVPKHVAEEVLSKVGDLQHGESRQNSNKPPNKYEKEAEDDGDELQLNSEHHEVENRKKKRMRKRERSSEHDRAKKQKPDPEDKKKPDSIRAQKRKKHAKLVEEKKLRADFTMTQKTLDYLSKWKHNRSEWKFEKLKQIWLQHNMYNRDKIPDEFWEMLMQYFNHSQGKVKQAILRDAVNIVEQQDLEDGQNSQNLKAERARDIIQNLSE